MRHDLHTHTHYSACSMQKPADLLKAAKKAGLNGVAVTDHHTIKGALEVKKLNKDRNFEVVVGEEVKVDEGGELLIFYVNTPIKRGSLAEVIEQARGQGALTSIAHPFRPEPYHRFKTPINKVAGRIDAVECLNGRNFVIMNKKAERNAEKFGFAKTAGSDGHFSFEVGKAYTIFEGDLEKAILSRKTRIEGTTKGKLIPAALSMLSSKVLRPLKIVKAPVV